MIVTIEQIFATAGEHDFDWLDYRKEFIKKITDCDDSICFTIDDIDKFPGPADEMIHKSIFACNNSFLEALAKHTHKIHGNFKNEACTLDKEQTIMTYATYIQSELIRDITDPKTNGKNFCKIITNFIG